MSNIVTIRATEFTPPEWGELYYATRLLPQEDGDDYDESVKVSAFESDVIVAMNDLERKAVRVESGDYGASDSDVDIEEWAAQLRAAKQKLLNIVTR